MDEIKPKNETIQNSFKVVAGKYDGEDWLIASFGCDEDGKNYYLTTDSLHCSQFCDLTKGAKGDAELCAELLNAYYNNKIKFVF